jgi:hypothetical protein
MKIPKTKPLDLTGQGLAAKTNFTSDNRTDKNNYSSIYHNCQDFTKKVGKLYQLKELILKPLQDKGVWA